MNMSERDMEELAARVVAKLEKRVEIYIAAQQKECAAMKSQMRDVKKTLYGNGDPGLKANMQRILTWLRVLAIVASGFTIATAGIIVLIIEKILF